MSTYKTPRTKRQLRHMDSLSHTHKLDKAAGERRSATRHIRVESGPSPSPKRSFPEELTGHAFMFNPAGDGWRRCSRPEEYADFVEKEHESRGFYVDTVIRDGRPRRMRRQAARPLQYLTVTFPPWASDWLEESFRANRNPLPSLARIRGDWLARTLPRVAERRFLVGLAFHADTDDPHFDLCCSRQDGSGARIGEPGLGLVGSWCVGVDRQIRCGAPVSFEKRDKFERDMANFARRYGHDAVPLDLQIARDFDAAVDKELGQEIEPFKRAYAARVPELSRAHLERELAVLDRARAKIVSELSGLSHSSGPSL